jgi:hypothetical protein
MTVPCRYGFRVVGNTAGRRRLVDAAAAFAGYAACDPKAEIDREAYLSAFWYGEDFKQYLAETGSTRGFCGGCWTPYLWLDIDHPDLPERALADARRLAMTVLERYRTLDEDDLLVFFSGSKGYHLGLPTCWAPLPSAGFHQTARRLAELLAGLAGVNIDTSVYDKVRCFRAPNSRHPVTGLHKRFLRLDELLHLQPGSIRGLAAEPIPFDLRAEAARDEQAAADWAECARLVREEAEAKAQRRAMPDGNPRLTRATLDFIRDGADVGHRHRLLFSAAANLAEFGCPSALAHALLTEAALDSGLPPKEVHRQIECGLQHAKEQEGVNGHA